jgi:hypothetical protein
VSARRWSARIPILLGGGIPLLPPPAVRAVLKLRKQRVYQKTGTISIEYDIMRREGAIMNGQFTAQR